MQKKLPLFVTLFGLGFILVSGTIDLDNLFNYANQTIPNYITKDNTGTNAIDDKVATLGRVLFYDKNLSDNNTIACASCHQQAFAFSDPLTTSLGLNGGNTGRHSMRLINARFADEVQFFWDERAVSLEDQVTKPIQDHVEMGYSGTSGQPDINDLIVKLTAIDYYETLFEFAFGDATITEERMQLALAQFVRSIQSFDSRFDDGLVSTNGNINAAFANFTAQENQGKQLFLAPPNMNGAGCAGCHRPPEFDIDPNSLNNGIISVANSSDIDLTNTRSPSLRDIINPDGMLNGPLMHDGSLTTIRQVIDHYNAIPDDPANTNLDNRLNPPGPGTQNLNLTDAEKDALEAFLRTLTGTDVYTNEIWSDPFDAGGNLTLTGSILSTSEEAFGISVTVYPNPVATDLKIRLEAGDYQVMIYNIRGQLSLQQHILGDEDIPVQSLSNGVYLLNIIDNATQNVYKQKFVKR
jgi:cytochrome c peroxidase